MPSLRRRLNDVTRRCRTATCLLLDVGLLAYKDLPLGRNSSLVLRRGGKGFRPCPPISPLLAGQQLPQ